jgi:hypothetical protein
MTVPVGVGKRRAVAGEGELVGHCLARYEPSESQDGRNQHPRFRHDHTLRVEVEFKSRGKTCKNLRSSALIRSAVVDMFVTVRFSRTSTTPFQTLSDTPKQRYLPPTGRDMER